MRNNIRINCLEIVTPIYLFDVNSWIDCLEIVTPIYLFDVNAWIDCFETQTLIHLFEVIPICDTKSIRAFKISSFDMIINLLLKVA